MRFTQRHCEEERSDDDAIQRARSAPKKEQCSLQTQWFFEARLPARDWIASSLRSSQ
jgi:hypothetical protein